ncbi:MAG: sensor histidine kinase [Chloroflexaceae bacterium]|nr:sensor histidine kinase [Chloroflexaceae bacterium]NJO07242.1 sensor histidine kinase [Chloroflexaceae bacterium]
MSDQDFRQKVESMRDTYREEQSRLQREINENEVLVRQVTADVEKLAQRELSVSNRVRDLDVNLERYSKAEIKNFYAAAQEVQMRLQMMRAQLDQLQVRQSGMRNQQKRLAEIVDLMDEMLSQDSGTRTGAANLEVNPEDQLANVILTHEKDLHRISLQIHDGPVQVMSNLVLRAEIVQRMIDRDIEQARTELASLKTAINNALQAGRKLIFDLRPMTIDDLGLIPTLRRFATQFGEQNKLEVNVIVQGLDTRLPSHYELTIFRFIQEALNNVSAHANANQARVLLSVYENMLQIVVEDDGSGFHVSEVLADKNARKGMGIANMRQRIEAILQGQFGVESSIGQGTRVAATVPMP